MKTILSAMLVLGFGGLAGADDDKKDDKKKVATPIGTWKCEYEIGEMKRTSELTIKKDSDDLAGTMDWPDQKNEKLTDVKFKDGTLSFHAVRKFMGQEIPIDYTLKIEGAKFQGKGASDFGGQTMEFEINGKREMKEVGGNVARADVEKELKKLEGVWTFESVEAGGKTTTADQFKGMTVVFKGDKYFVKVGDKVVETATQMLDPSKAPKTLDSKVTDGPNKGKVYLCIYEISGDTLKVCFDPEGKKRPKEFKTAADSPTTLVVHKRVKKQEKSDG